MNSYYVQLTLDMGQPEDRDVFEAHLDDVAEAFADITDVDGDVGVDLESGRVDLCMTVTAPSLADALGRAVTAARTAVHTAGGQTPGWDGLLKTLLDNDEYLLSSAPSSWGHRADCSA